MGFLNIPTEIVVGVVVIVLVTIGNHLLELKKLKEVDGTVTQTKTVAVGIELSQTIAAIQAMATQMAELKSQVEQTADRENNLRQELAGVKEEFNEEKQKNQVLLRENRSLRKA